MQPYPLYRRWQQQESIRTVATTIHQPVSAKPSTRTRAELEVLKKSPPVYESNRTTCHLNRHTILTFLSLAGPPASGRPKRGLVETPQRLHLLHQDSQVGAANFEHVLIVRRKRKCDTFK